MSRFWCAEPLTTGATVTLSSEESHHLMHVLRLTEGDRVQVIDGLGKVAAGTVIQASARGSRVALDQVETHPPRSRIQVCFGIPKPTATEFILRRATEIGVAGFQPLGTQHSLAASQWNDRRWQKIIHEVCKQCEEVHFPILHPPRSLASWMAARDPGRTLVFCDEGDRDAALALVGRTAPVDLIVGAEGGWSREEAEKLKAAGALSFGLGKNRLRAETAALVGAILLKKMLGEI